MAERKTNVEPVPADDTPGVTGRDGSREAVPSPGVPASAPPGCPGPGRSARPHAESKGKPDLWQQAIRAAGVALGVLAIVQVMSAVHSARTGGQHLDYRTYYLASQALASGQNPYDARLLADMANRPAVRSFLYPPSSFFLFVPLGTMSYEASADVFLLLKLAALIGLLGIWFRCFLKVSFLSWDWVVAALAVTQGFGRPIVIDIREGNVSLIEQVLMWSAFAGLLEQRYLSFAILIVLAGLFKLVPAAFLGVLLLVTGGSLRGAVDAGDWTRRLRALVAGAVMFVAIQALSYGIYPVHFVRALQASIRVDERGFNNPSSLALFRDWSGVEGAWPIYAGWLLLVLAVAAGAVLKRSGRLTTVEWLVLSILTFTLATPRMKNYSYIVVLLPLAWISTHVLRGSMSAQLALLIVVSWPLFAYQPLIGASILYAIFVGYLVRAQEGGVSADSGRRIPRQMDSQMARSLSGREAQ